MTTPISDADLAKLQELAEKATPGPWQTQSISDEGEERGLCFIVGATRGGLVGASMPWPTEFDFGDFRRVKANADFIVALVNAFHALSSRLANAEQALRSAKVEFCNTTFEAIKKACDERDEARQDRDDARAEIERLKAFARDRYSSDRICNDC